MQNPMHTALALAQSALLLTSPNPRVGCVIASPDGIVLGQGHTLKAGGPHAEIMALRDAAAHGHSVQGATVYVTLEPCAHHGRTGPCCDALVAAGIQTVVAAIADPNPKVAGQGFARLRAAGVAVIELERSSPEAMAARALNLGFFSRMVRKTPWVRLKTAASLDGVTALHNHQSQWITSPAARADGHAWRARACAVLTGIGTLLHDNPRLDVRLVPTPRQPVRVIIDSRLQTPPDAQIFDSADGAEAAPVWIYTAISNPDPVRLTALLARGANVTCLPHAASGKVDMVAVMHDLARREINELHVEAGSALNGALLQAGLVDEFLVYLAPRFLGSGRGMADFGPLQQIADGMNLEFVSVDRIGPDLRVVARVQGRDVF